MLVAAEGLLRYHWPEVDRRVHLMVSGGPDSMALLALAHPLPHLQSTYSLFYIVGTGLATRVPVVRPPAHMRTTL